MTVQNSLTEATTRVGKIATELNKRGITGQTWKVLKETIYPNAKDESILMALDYCKVRQLDILKKPVHIVPIWDKESKKMVDTIWQSINELRITAMRTKQYAGIDEVVYGEDITQDVHGVQMTFPKYAQVTVYKLMGGVRVPFVSDKVFWLENYARKKDGEPNAMWQQRPYGQIAKCAEANALKKAFPEEIGSEYTIDETGSQIVNVDEIETIKPQTVEPVIETEPIQDQSAQVSEKVENQEAKGNDPFDVVS